MHSIIRIPLLECAFDSRSNTVDVVTEFTILKWTEKMLLSGRKMEVLPNDAMVIGWNEQNWAIFLIRSGFLNWLVRHEQEFLSKQQIQFFSLANNLNR